MTKRTWFSMKASGKKAAEVSIYDEIGAYGVTAKDFGAQLKALGNVKNITVHINSPGGAVTDGFAIHDMLVRHDAFVTTVVEGVAASMASVILMAGNERRATENAFVMIHNPFGGLVGESKDMRKMADLLDKMTARLAAVYVNATLLTVDEVKALMDGETWFDASEALASGLIDEVDEAMRVAAKFDLKRFFNNPPTGATMAKKPNKDTLDNFADELDSDEVAAISTAAVAKDKERRADIRAMCALAGVTGKDADELIDSDKTPGAVLKELDEKRAKAATDKKKKDDELNPNRRANTEGTTDAGVSGKVNFTEIWDRYNKRGKFAEGRGRRAA